MLAAAEAAAQGQPLPQVVAAVHEARAGLDMWFCLDTLEYLRKGGRIGAAQALVGSALKIKPILTFGTEIAPVGKVRTKKRAMERMVAYLQRAARARRQRLDRPARPGLRGRRDPGRRGQGDLRHRAPLLHPGRPRARRPPRLRDAGRRRRLRARRGLNGAWPQPLFSCLARRRIALPLARRMN